MKLKPSSSHLLDPAAMKPPFTISAIRHGYSVVKTVSGDTIHSLTVLPALPAASIHFTFTFPVDVIGPL